jgi:hypothetical protein
MHFHAANSIMTMVPPPSSKIMPKHYENSGGIGKKNIHVELGSVHVDSMQQTIKTHLF